MTLTKEQRAEMRPYAETYREPIRGGIRLVDLLDALDEMERERDTAREIGKALFATQDESNAAMASANPNGDGTIAQGIAALAAERDAALAELKQARETITALQSNDPRHRALSVPCPLEVCKAPTGSPCGGSTSNNWWHTERGAP